MTTIYEHLEQMSQNEWYEFCIYLSGWHFCDFVQQEAFEHESKSKYFDELMFQIYFKSLISPLTQALGRFHKLLKADPKERHEYLSEYDLDRCEDFIKLNLKDRKEMLDFFDKWFFKDFKLIWDEKDKPNKDIKGPGTKEFSEGGKIK